MGTNSSDDSHSSSLLLAPLENSAGQQVSSIYSSSRSFVRLFVFLFLFLLLSQNSTSQGMKIT